MKNLKKLEKRLYFKILIPIVIFVIALSGWITLFEAVHINQRETKLELRYNTIIDTNVQRIHIEDSINFVLQRELTLIDSTKIIK